MTAVVSLRIPPLVSGGLMLTYRCTSRCRHCLYRCSPDQPDTPMSPPTLDAVVASLAREPDLQGIHIAGGEPTLHMDFLLHVIRTLKDAGIPIDYMETNASWCSTTDRTRDTLRQLQAAGLPALLVSASMFHNEFVPFAFTRRCVEIGREVLGSSGVIVYLPHLYEMLARTEPQDRPHSLEEFARAHGLQDSPERIPALYNVMPGGRAAAALRSCYTPRPVDEFRGLDCREQLLSTTHFHVDPDGNLFTGCCAGITPTAVGNCHDVLTVQTHPVFWTLCRKGPVGVSELAADSGFVPRSDGYVSTCDLCFDARRHLARTGAFPELQPRAFYEGD